MPRTREPAILAALSVADLMPRARQGRHLLACPPPRRSRHQPERLRMLPPTSARRATSMPRSLPAPKWPRSSGVRLITRTPSRIFGARRFDGLRPGDQLERTGRDLLTRACDSITTLTPHPRWQHSSAWRINVALPTHSPAPRDATPHSMRGWWRSATGRCSGPAPPVSSTGFAGVCVNSDSAATLRGLPRRLGVAART